MSNHGSNERIPERAGLLSRLALGSLSAEELAKLEGQAAADPALADEVRQHRELEGLLAHGAPRHPAPSSLRARVLASAVRASPLAAFLAELGQLFDLGRAAVEAVLERAASAAAWEPGPAAGIEIFHLDGGPRVAALDAGLVRLRPGAVFPPHRHVGGPELVLVLTGAYLDTSGTWYRAGDTVELPAGSVHGFTADAEEGVVFAVLLHEVEDVE